MQANLDSTLEQQQTSAGPFARKESFAENPLTLAQRVQLGTERYYRPFHVEKMYVLQGKQDYWLIKRVFDVVCASLALLVLSPFILLTLAAIFIEDPKGSPVFVQDRVGKGGRTFRFFKMRSMHVDAEARLGELMAQNEFQGKAFKMKDDPRITRVGKIIRNASIDELLQLVNVLKGDMSIVGPRPPLPREVAQYDDYEKQRLIVTPGLTCFWQVYPKRHEISFDDWVALDVKYVVERSWRTDFKLILDTILVIFKGHAD